MVGVGRGIAEPGASGVGLGLGFWGLGFYRVSGLGFYRVLGLWVL